MSPNICQVNIYSNFEASITISHFPESFVYFLPTIPPTPAHSLHVCSQPKHPKYVSEVIAYKPSHALYILFWAVYLLD